MHIYYFMFRQYIFITVFITNASLNTYLLLFLIFI